MKLGFFLLCNAFTAIADHVLPWYITKCSISNPNLNQCIATNGNLAIPKIIKGDCFFNNPISTPLYIPEINLPGEDFAATLRNVYLKGLGTFKIIDINFNLAIANQKIILEGPLLEISADYIIYNNTNKLIRSVQGGGKLEAILHRNILNYTLVINERNVNGVSYINLLSDNLKLTTRKMHYELSRIYSNYHDNLNWVLKKHKQIIEEKVRPAIERLMLNYMSNLTNNLSKKLSILEIFKP